jgi:hypothetical protein
MEDSMDAQTEEFLSNRDAVFGSLSAGLLSAEVDFCL